ncbi:unnamed protein product, partial [Closterium sp. NIES-54]
MGLGGVFLRAGGAGVAGSRKRGRECGGAGSIRGGSVVVLVLGDDKMKAACDVVVANGSHGMECGAGYNGVVCGASALESVVAPVLEDGKKCGGVGAVDGKMKACDVRASYAKIGRNTNTPGLQPNASLRADPSLLLNRALLSPALCTRTCTTKRRAKPPGAEDLLGRDSGATVLPGEEPMVALGRTGGEVGEMEDEDGKREKEGEGGNERERRKGGEEREGSVIGGEKGKEGSILGKDEPDRNADVAVVFKSSPLMCLSRIGRLASEARRSLVYPPHLHLAVDHLITKHIQLQAGGESGGGGEEDSAENGERGQMHGGGGGGGGEGVVVVAAHWRVEKALRAGVRQRQMAACARGLVDTVRGWATRVGGVSGGSGGRENEGAGGAEGKEGGEQQVAVFLATDLTPDNRCAAASRFEVSCSQIGCSADLQAIHPSLPPFFLPHLPAFSFLPTNPSVIQSSFCMWLRPITCTAENLFPRCLKLHPHPLPHSPSPSSSFSSPFLPPSFLAFFFPTSFSFQLMHGELRPITWAAADSSVPQLDTGVQESWRLVVSFLPDEQPRKRSMAASDTSASAGAASGPSTAVLVAGGTAAAAAALYLVLKPLYERFLRRDVPFGPDTHP